VMQHQNGLSTRSWSGNTIWEWQYTVTVIGNQLSVIGIPENRIPVTEYRLQVKVVSWQKAPHPVLQIPLSDICNNQQWRSLQHYPWCIQTWGCGDSISTF
jgi:hypothetical protein